MWHLQLEFDFAVFKQEDQEGDGIDNEGHRVALKVSE